MARMAHHPARVEPRVVVGGGDRGVRRQPRGQVARPETDATGGRGCLRDHRCASRRRRLLSTDQAGGRAPLTAGVTNEAARVEVGDRGTRRGSRLTRASRWLRTGCKRDGNWPTAECDCRRLRSIETQPIREDVTPDDLSVTCSGQTENHGVGGSTPSLATLPWRNEDASQRLTCGSREVEVCRCAAYVWRMADAG